VSPSPEIAVALAGRLGTFTLDATFNVPMRGITALFGPSGCGKTTILRCIAGLEQLPGTIVIGGLSWQDTSARHFLPPHRRHVGYVFQEASLFQHMSVRQNLLFGALRAVPAAGSPTVELATIVDLLGIGHLLERSPTTLSGGERQRVAVGRALLSRPHILLMDEPLSALDRQTKDEILPYFETLHETLALPVLYVSHDLGEIERLADTMVLMSNGRVMANGPLRELQTDPRLPLLATPGAAVVLEGRIGGIDAEFGLTRIAIDGGEVVAPGRHGEAGAKRRVRIAASDVSLARSAASDSTILNSLPARIETIEQQSDEPQVNVILALGANGEGSRIVARITRKSLMRLELEAGQSVFAQIKSVALVASRPGRATESSNHGGSA
jgi:molybdate transport system ATP-binding protein